MITNKDARIEYDVFRNNLKYYRKQLHWSQEDLAEQSDLPSFTVSCMINWLQSLIL